MLTRLSHESAQSFSAFTDNGSSFFLRNGVALSVGHEISLLFRYNWDGAARLSLGIFNLLFDEFFSLICQLIKLSSLTASMWASLVAVKWRVVISSLPSLDLLTLVPVSARMASKVFPLAPTMKEMYSEGTSTVALTEVTSFFATSLWAGQRK